MARALTIKQLHAKTGEAVRRAGQARAPTSITDRGRQVAVLAAPHLLPPRPRERSLLPEYAAWIRRTAAHDVQDDLNAVRGDR